MFDARATESGRPYFVMELVKGVPITEFCDKNHLPTEARLTLFIDVCHAIQHAHHKGIIHRDVKPSNVMVTLHDGVPVVKVIDFGVAKATVQKLTERTLFTAYGQMIGTPAYMSPEQAEMSGLDIDTRSDIYSLGVLLYELLTGTTPLESKRLREAGYAELQRIIREDEPPRPSTRLSSLGDSATVLAGNRGLDVRRLVQLLAGDLDWVVMKALEKDRSRRYGTPGSFAEDLERYLRREAILARPPSTAYKFKKFAQRNRPAVLTAAAVVAALVIGAAVATWQAVRATGAEARALADRDEKEQARKAEANQRQRAEANEHKAVTAWAETDKSRLAAEKAAAESRERLVRLHVANGVRLMDEGDLFSALPALVEALRLDLGDPERERVHRVRIGAVLRQCPKLVQVWTCEQPVTHAELSPDGRRLLMVSGKTVTVQNAETGNALFPPLVHDQSVTIARFSPDGKQIGSATGEYGAKKGGAVHLWDALIGMQLGPALIHPDAVKDVAFHPRDQSVATTCADNKIRVWKQGEGNHFRETKVRQFGETRRREMWVSDSVFTSRFTPDGTRVLVTFHLGWANNVGVALWNPTTDTVDPSVIYYGSGRQYAHTDISPDGRFFWAERGVRDTATGAALHPQIPIGDHSFVAFSPDNRKLIAGDGEAQVWDATRGARIGRPLEHRGTISAVGFSPDAGQVVTASVDGTARVWDVRTGKPASPWLIHGGSVTHATFSPNGHQVLTVSTDRTVRLWDLANEEPVANRLFVADGANYSGPSPTGKHYIAVEGQMAALWDPQQGLRRLPYFALGGSIESSGYNADETLLITGTADQAARVWDVQSGRSLFAPLAHAKPVNSAEFIRDDSCILTVAQYYSLSLLHTEVLDENGSLLPQHRGADLHLWDARSGQALTPVMTMPVWVFSTDVSPDGGLLAAVGGDDRYESGALYLWDAKTGRLLWNQKLPRPARYVAFSPEGRLLVTAEAEGIGLEPKFNADAATIWDVATGQQKWVFEHAGSIAWMGFHPSEPHLVTASSDRTVRLWNFQTGQPLGSPLLHPEAVQDAAFIADGRFIASATKQGDVRLWDPITGEPVAPWLPRAYHEYSQYSIGGDFTHVAYLNTIDREWNTRPALHIFDDLVVLSNLLALGTASGNQGQDRFSAATFRESWRRLKDTYPDYFQRSAVEILNWHQRETLAYTNSFSGFRAAEDPSRWYSAGWHADRLLPLLAKPARNWLILRAGIKHRLGQANAALDDYTAALEMAPRDDALLEARAKLWIEQAEYAKAKEDLQRAMAILFAEHQQAKAQQGAAFSYSAHDVLYDSTLHEDLPRLCLLQNDQAGYRQACEQLLELSRQNDQDRIGISMAWTCLLTPQGFVDPPRILALAEKSAGDAGNDAEALRTHGAALFRAGKFDESARRLDQALAVQPEFPSAWLFLAMTQQRRGHAEEAKAWVEKAAVWIERETREKQKPWGERASLEALLREARQQPGLGSGPSNEASTER